MSQVQMKTVTIRSATFFGREIEVGTYPFIEVVTPSPSDNCKREVYVRIIRDGKNQLVQANRADFTINGELDVATAAIVAEPKPEIDDATLGGIISKRFKIMNIMAEGVVSGEIRALIVSGAPGIGKTYSLEERLASAEMNGEINRFTHLKGKTTPLALFATLYQHKDAGDVLLIDDCDTVFSDEISLNLLKGALDTGKRNLAWKSASTWLADNGIEDEFEFEGTIVFITNLNFSKRIEKGSSDAVHLQALISRSNYLDLMVHSNREILIRVKQIIEGTNIIAKQGLTPQQGEELTEWLVENRDKMLEISIRSVLKIAAYIKADPIEWQDMASVMMLRTMY